MIPDRRSLVGAAVATLGLVVALAARPVSPSEIVAGYVLALAAIELTHLTRVARGEELWLRNPSDFERALAQRSATRVRPAELVRIERELTLGSATAEHYHTRLAPLLREAAAARLAAHEIDLELRPDRARAALGDGVWDLIRPDRPAPAERNAAGPPLRTLAGVIDTIERV